MKLNRQASLVSLMESIVALIEGICWEMAELSIVRVKAPNRWMTDYISVSRIYPDQGKGGGC